MNKIEISLSKTKISLLLIGAIVFVLLGTLFLVIPDTFISPIIRNPQVIRIAGIVAILFFGLVGVYIFRKLFDKTTGLTIDEKGITDNTNATSVGLIDWSDITEIKTQQIMSTRFLLIYVNNSDKYLDRVNGFKQKLMKGNMKLYGTPISITSNTLRYKFDDLERLLKSKLIEKQQQMPNH